MPIPYRKTPKTLAEGSVAYLDVIWLRSVRTFYGAIFVVDGLGQPVEFVHNTLVAPAGFLWSEEKVKSLGTAALVHSLFDACRREPDLLICLPALGSAGFCKTELAPSVPFAQVCQSQDGLVEWSWINDPPSPGMRAHQLYQQLSGHEFALEPFERLRSGLREIYPDAPWQEASP